MDENNLLILLGILSLTFTFGVVHWLWRLARKPPTGRRERIISVRAQLPVADAMKAVLGLALQANYQIDSIDEPEGRVVVHRIRDDFYFSLHIVSIGENQSVVDVGAILPVFGRYGWILQRYHERFANAVRAALILRASGD